MTLRNLTASVLFAGLTFSSTALFAEEYEIDTKGAHAFIQFRVQHLGYSWLYGRFNTFEGSFDYDENNPSASKVSVEIDTVSVDSNHAERDKHLRSDDFLDVSKYPKASFVSTSFQDKGDGKAALQGNLTLHGVTKPITIDVMHVGAGKDPLGWISPRLFRQHHAHAEGFRYYQKSGARLSRGGTHSGCGGHSQIADRYCSSPSLLRERVFENRVG